MESPWGVCASSASIGSGQHHGGPLRELKGANAKDKLECLVGIDWGTVTHRACATDAIGLVLDERDFAHGGAGLAEMADWIVATAKAARNVLQQLKGPGTGLRSRSVRVAA